ncbi:MAG: DUF1129 family protein [Bacillota bacterium]|nr:DUF1129 family protein [Bacillota bacterium]
MNRQTKALLKENNELEKKLGKDTNEILTDIVVYIRGSRISEYNQEIIRRDITNMLIEGQERGQTAREVIGDDYKAFCDAIIAEMPEMSAKERVLNAIQIACMCLGNILLIWFVFSLVRGSVREVYITLGDIVSGAVIILSAIGIVMAITKDVFDDEQLSGWKLFFIYFVISAACILPSVFIRTVVLTVPSAAVLIIIALLFAGYKLVDNI